jgi:hypothetical protein
MEPIKDAFYKGMSVGIFIMLLIVGAWFIRTYVEKWSHPLACTGTEARENIVKFGFKLNDLVTDPYFFTDNTIGDHTTFLSFSGQEKVLDKIVEEKTGKKVTQLPRWESLVKERKELEQAPVDPGALYEQYRTLLYEYENVKDGVCFVDKIPQGMGFWYLSYNRKQGRVYYCWINY